MIFRASRHRELARELVEFLARREQQARFYRLTGDLPARREAWADSGLAKDREADAFRIQLERAVPTPMVPEWEEVTTKLMDHVEAAVRGGQPPATALAALDGDVDRLLERRRYLKSRRTDGALTLEFKLLDRTAENVWWHTERDRVFDGEWHKITVRKRQIRFAWGPLGGGTLDRVAAIELVITAGQGGGSGRIWFDELTLTPMPDLGPYNLAPEVTATSSAARHPPSALLDGDPTTSWRPVAPRASFTIDFLRPREYGGLTLVWDSASAAAEYAVRVSDDGSRWRTVAGRHRGLGTRDYVYLPDTESRFLRVDLLGSRGPKAPKASAGIDCGPALADQPLARHPSPRVVVPAPLSGAGAAGRANAGPTARPRPVPDSIVPRATASPTASPRG